MSRSLEPAQIQPRLTTNWLGTTYQFLDRTPSTNTLLSQCAAEGAPHGTVVVADSQTAGRGRLGRPWVSPAGVNLYVSVLLRPQWDTRGQPPLSLAAGVALAEALAAFLPARPVLKWPNDLLAGGQKLAGILAEVSVQKERISHAVIGLGVNVNQETFAADLEDTATSLRLLTNSEHDRATILVGLLAELEQWCDALAAGRGTSVIEQWTCYADWLGKTIRVVTPSGERRGTAIGLAEDGTLRLRLPRGRVEHIAAGEVVIDKV